MSVPVLQTDVTLQVLIWIGSKEVTLLSCVFFQLISIVQCREITGLLLTVTLQGGANEDDLWQPTFLGQKVVVLSSTPGFWDQAKTNTAIYYVLFFGWDVIELGSLLQISRNILKTDGDNQCFLASISSITQRDCNIPSVNRNRMSCWNLFYQPLLVVS